LCNSIPFGAATCEGPEIEPAPALLLLALAAALTLLASPAYAHINLTEANPPEGAGSDAPPGETAAPGETLQAAGPIAQEGDDDGGPDILFLALITTASVGGAVALFTLGYLLRRRIGCEPHRPPEGEDEREGH
jgi:hypothetical protein